MAANEEQGNTYNPLSATLESVKDSANFNPSSCNLYSKPVKQDSLSRRQDSLARRNYHRAGLKSL